MRVLEITARSDHGGGPKHVSDLLEGLRDQFLIFVAAPSRGFYGEFFKRKAGAYFDLPERRFSIISLIRLIFFIKKYNVDLIHSHGRGAGVYGRLAGFLAKVPVIHTHHGLYLEAPSYIHSQILILVEKFFNALSKKLIYVSNSEIQYSQKYQTFSFNKSTLIPNGVAIPNFKGNGSNSATTQLITITRLEPEKGNAILIKLMTKLAEINSNIHLKIVGDGPERVFLEKKVKDGCLEDKITFLGHRNDIENLLTSSDLFISSSLAEAQGIAILEAMSYGLPIFASQVRGHIDLILNNENGILFSLEDLDMAAKTLADLINNPGLMKAMGASGMSQVHEKYHVNKMLEKISSLYDGLGITNNTKMVE